MLTTSRTPLLRLVAAAVPCEVRGRVPFIKGVRVRESRDGAVMMTWLRGGHHCTVRMAPARDGYELLYVEAGLGFVRSWRCPLDEALLKDKRILR